MAIRTINSVKNLKWFNPEKTILICDVDFDELDELFVPFSTSNPADTEHGQEIWDKANAGEYGVIANYKAPTVAERRAQFPTLTPRQFRIGLAHVNVTEQMVDDALQGNEINMIEWKWATSFERTHPLVSSLAPLLGITAQQIDDLWLWMSTL